MAIRHAGNDEPAFPTPDYYDERPYGITPGMSLRDCFAAQALIGWLADGAIARIMVGHQVDDAGALKILADGCYRAADAMLKAREESR